MPQKLLASDCNFYTSYNRQPVNPIPLHLGILKHLNNVYLIRICHFKSSTKLWFQILECVILFMHSSKEYTGILLCLNSFCFLFLSVLKDWTTFSYTYIWVMLYCRWCLHWGKIKASNLEAKCFLVWTVLVCARMKQRKVHKNKLK